MLMQQETRVVARRRGLLSSQAVHLALYLVLGVVTPFVVWSGLHPGLSDRFVTYTLPTIMAACVGTWYMLAKLRNYARARHLSYVLPVNLLTFAAASAVLFALRLPYSLSLLGSAAISTTVVSYLITARTRRGNRRLHLIAGGRIDEIEHNHNHIHITSSKELEWAIEARALDGAVVADLHHEHSAEWERLFAKAALAGIPVYHFRQIIELESGQVRIDHLSENTLGSLIPNSPYMAAKRLTDILLTLVLLPVLVPMLLAIAAAIRIDSRGPVLFIQERVGFRGETFRMIKFRTMRERKLDDCSLAERDDAMTRDDDDRITSIGRFLRKMRLDELPQAWNILKGEMSWIGPRPEAIRLSEWYESELPFYSYRHIVRPGLTGWAQVNQGHVTDLDAVNDKLRYDFYYVKNISHWLDMLIALKTVRVIVGGFGAR